MRVVLDTNLWVSALLNPAGPPGRFLEHVALGQLAVFSTRHLWAEFERALSYQKVQAALEKRRGREQVAVLLKRFEATVTLVESIEPAQRWVQKDADDDWVVQCAISAQAAAIVTGDRNLLELQQVAGVEILTPADALVWIEKSTSGT